MVPFTFTFQQILWFLYTVYIYLYICIYAMFHQEFILYILGNYVHLILFNIYFCLYICIKEVRSLEKQYDPSTCIYR